MRRCKRIALVAAASSVAWFGPAWADDEKERALEQRVEDLQRQLDEISRRVGDGSSRSEDELEQRIAELEKISKKDQDGLFAYWKTGLKLDSVDGAFKLSVFGRIQQDWVFWDRDDDITSELGETNSSVEFRRARIGLGGTIYKNIIYKAEYDFAGAGTGVFKDVYMELKDAYPGVNVRVGHFDEPQGLDGLTSSKYTTFTERSLLEAFRPERNAGVMVYGGAMENRLAWFAGFFRDTDNFGNRVSPDLQGEHDLVARVTGRPYVSEDGAEWIHVGASVLDRRPNNEMVQFRSRPEVHVGPQFVDTGAVADVDSNTQWDLEAAGVFGAFSFQAEWLQADISGKGDQDDLSFDAKSVQVSMFLTGEHREYDVPAARFDRVKVRKNYGAEGMGAWELAARWSNIDLDDQDVTGGELTDWTLGVNWYLNSNTRVMFDIVHADRKDVASINAFIMSFRIDF